MPTGSCSAPGPCPRVRGVDDADDSLPAAIGRARRRVKPARTDVEVDLPERGREVVLRDGRVVVLRASRADEGGALFELYRHLSVDSREARFFGQIGETALREEAER